MKLKFLLMTLVVFLPLSSFVLNADEQKNKQEIPLYPTLNGGQENNNRSLIQLPIECHYFGIMNTIVTTVQSDLGDVLITVTNCSTGNVWYSSFDSAMDPQNFLPISGAPGIYEINYITESGRIFEGTFMLE
mgnify:FL=1